MRIPALWRHRKRLAAARSKGGRAAKNLKNLCSGELKLRFFGKAKQPACLFSSRRQASHALPVVLWWNKIARLGWFFRSISRNGRRNI